MSLNMFYLSVHRKCSCTLGVGFHLSLFFNLKNKIIQKTLLTLRKISSKLRLNLFFFYSYSAIVFIALPRNSFHSITCPS